MWVKIRKDVRHSRNGGETELLSKGEVHELPAKEAESLIAQHFAEEAEEPKHKPAAAPSKGGR